MSNPTIVWFRRDLRLTDHRALAAAAERGTVVAIYILSDDDIGAASRWWLHHSLRNLQSSIERQGGQLILRRGDPIEQLRKLVSETTAEAVMLSRGYSQAMRDQEQRVHDQLSDQVVVKRYRGSLLFEPEQVLKGSGDPYKVFTPMWKRLRELPEPVPTEVGAIDWHPQQLSSDPLDSWSLLPTKPDWAGGLREHWHPGEAGATDQLQQFLTDAVKSYRTDRDRPDRDGTSGLSPHLHFGEVGPATVWQQTRQAMHHANSKQDGGWSFLRELGWRDFSYQLLTQYPQLASEPFRSDYARFPWQQDRGSLEAWQRGLTGYPFVDAGMRQLWHTGWMHNRVRMVVASFLVKHLLIPWQQGAEWFWDTLVDADLANNSASWQWVAGCGADAAPYFRIFNPITQGEKFDPHGRYVRRWVPELSALPDKFIHQPWTASSIVLKNAQIKLDETYPKPIVEHKAARERALAALAELKRINNSESG